MGEATGLGHSPRSKLLALLFPPCTVQGVDALEHHQEERLDQMSTANNTFQPYIGQLAPEGRDFDEEFSIDLIEENLEKGYRTIRTPEGQVAFIWLLENEGTPVWRIYFLKCDGLIPIEYYSLKSFWPHCDSIMRGFLQAHERKVAYDKAHSGKSGDNKKHSD